MSGTDLLFTEHHVPALFVLHALDDVLLGDFLARHLVDTLVAHRVHAAAVEPVEIDASGGRCGDQRHGDVHQSEADCAFPDCPCHGRLLASDVQVTCGPLQKFLWSARRFPRRINRMPDRAGEFLVNKSEPRA
ncbi:hypothetical protein D3C79_841570 [compost metagenome]